MKFKKVVSAFSALAMAISVFASFGVTANAEETFTYDVLYGTETKDGDTTTGVTVQTDFTENNATLETATAFAGTTFLEGSVLDPSTGAITKNFAEPISEGVVHFAASYTVVGGKTNHIKLVDSTGATVVALYPGDKNSSATLSPITVGTVSGDGVYIYTPRNVAHKLNDLTIDFDANTYSYSFDLCTGGSSGTVNKVTTHTGSGTLDGVTDIAGFVADSSSYKIDNVYLYSVKSSATKYDYTINYKLDGVETPVKVSTASVAADTVITAESVFTEDGQKYFITADTAPTLTVTADGTNTLDVTVRKANEYTCKVVADVNGTEQELSNTTIVEGETFSYTYPMYIVDETTAYEVAAASGTYYGSSVANVTADQTITLTYNNATYENVVLYDELDGSTDKNAGIRASNCSAYNNAAYTSSVELEPGYYTIKVRFANIGRNSTMTIGDDVIIDTSADCTKNDWVTSTKNIYVSEAASLVWNAGDSGTYDCLDTILVMEAAAPTITTASATADGDTALPAQPTDATVLLNTADDADSGKTYADAAPTGTTVKTIYAKIENPLTAKPVIKIGGVEMASKWTAVSGTNIYFAQFIGGEDEFTTGGAYEDVKIVCGGVEQAVAWN